MLLDDNYSNHVDLLLHCPGQIPQDQSYFPKSIHDEDLPHFSNSPLKEDVTPPTMPSKGLSSPACEHPPNAEIISQPREVENPSHPQSQAKQPHQQADTGTYII